MKQTPRHPYYLRITLRNRPEHDKIDLRPKFGPEAADLVLPAPSQRPHQPRVDLRVRLLILLEGLREHLADV
ncbi:MAG: hypothetical protein M1826_006260 [Phylliscum demangeonii]|nr:MAG: hypothetical protein M1826_006260 [Phylliscum demangeonii]